MPTSSALQTNAFQETILGLTYAERPDPIDLFSRACVEQYQEFSTEHFGYLLTQVFEPNVLLESALLADVPYESVAMLEQHPTEPITRLAELVAQRDDLAMPGLVNLAAALISISRFAVASAVLDTAAARSREPREAFETAMLRFIVANRRDDGEGSAAAFAGMRAAIEAGTLPDHRILDACTQAMVWYLKRREIPRSTFTWFVRTGHRLVESRRDISPGALSAWYRGLAMIPAAKGDAHTTQRYMTYARRSADDMVAQRPFAYELHLVKTYHESSIKEYMYVTPDPDRAVDAALKLIDLDPAWAPSYGELGDACVRFHKLDIAAEAYERAIELGPPYFGHHLLQAARVQAARGNEDLALEHYEKLMDLNHTNEALRREARELSERTFRSAGTRLAPAPAGSQDEDSPA